MDYELRAKNNPPVGAGPLPANIATIEDKLERERRARKTRGSTRLPPEFSRSSDPRIQTRRAHMAAVQPAPYVVYSTAVPRIDPALLDDIIVNI